MLTILDRYARWSRSRRRVAERTHQRLDIQGLRMVAVLIVFANHLWGWPQGGFIGVDVFFVISGFLITGNLLRSAEKTGTVSFKKFYWNRVRRIVPAATVVLILIYLTSALLFLPFRANDVGVDALFAFAFLANWHFALQDTDYFAATETVSPVQHFWSLSIEEQFYFVWPALILLICLLVARQAWNHRRRMLLAGAVVGAVSAASFGWAVIETASSPTWAYFNTFSRVWELGVGALLATVVGAMARIPPSIKPWLSWAGLALIGASLYLINDDSVGFPAPWALLPVAGTAAVIAAGVGEEPRFQGFLRNPVSTYIGNFSYSLYLVHWPVIVFLGTMMDTSTYYYLCALTLAFGLAIASYHFIENPLRGIDREKIRLATRLTDRAPTRVNQTTRYAALGAFGLVTVALCSYALPLNTGQTPSSLAAVAPAEFDQSGETGNLGPSTMALQAEILEALKATKWPDLDPTMESVIDNGLQLEPEVTPCSRDLADPDPELCVYGSSSAMTRVVLVGDSVGLGYAGPLREIALNSGGRVQLINEAMGSCAFTDDLIDRQPLFANCAARKQHAVDTINSIKPAVVIISNRYGQAKIVGATEGLGPAQWSQSVRKIVDKFRANAGKVILLSPPPGDMNVKDCYSKRSSTPAQCIGGVTGEWMNIALSEQKIAREIGGLWLDSRQWFCSKEGECPSFAGSTPTKFDRVHMSVPYGRKIQPAMAETLAAAGVS